mgnify:CR=1 FL=1|jgi:hypothetical protein
MILSKRDCKNLIDALMEYDEQICPKELEDGEVGLNAERLDDLVKRLKRAEDLPAHEDKIVWVLDASSGIVFKVEVPAHFPENGDYEDFLEANLPNDIRLKDCNWMVGGVDAVTIHRHRYHLGF